MPKLCSGDFNPSYFTSTFLCLCKYLLTLWSNKKNIYWNTSIGSDTTNGMYIHCQVYHSQPTSRILVCCPENTAADLVFKKLISPSLPGPVKTSDIFRLYAISRPLAAVPQQIRVFSLLIFILIPDVIISYRKNLYLLAIWTEGLKIYCNIYNAAMAE